MPEGSVATEVKLDVGQRESVEKSFERPNLFFHGTNGTRAEFLQEHGLLASKPTLTTSLEIAARYGVSGGERMGRPDAIPVVTFWYPDKHEVYRPTPQLTNPTTSVSPEGKQDLARAIIDSAIPGKEKQQILEFVKEAQLILPSARLGATILVSEQANQQIMDFQHEFDEDGLERYVRNKDQLIAKAKEILANTKTIFLRADKTVDQLAEDVVKTGVEHQLLTIGTELQKVTDGIRSDDPVYNERDRVKSFWERERKHLSELHFTEPVYERYRKSLITRTGQLLGTLQ